MFVGGRNIIVGVIRGVRRSERSTVAGVIRGIGSMGMIGGMVWGIGSGSNTRSVVGCEGKGTFWGRITRVVAATISSGKGGYFSKYERLSVEGQVFPRCSSEIFVISVE